MGEFVRLEVEDGVGTIRLDRPKMNALNVQVQEEIREAAAEATARTDVKAVIVYGGERVFAAGADIKEMQAMSYTDMVERSGPLMTSISAVARIPKPVIAAITGYALGGGCELALACDFRVVADDAKLGQPEILLGVIPGAGGTQRLSRLVGASRAKEIIFSGRFVDAQEALAIGLADKVVPAADVYAASREWASTFVGAASFAVRAAKEAIDRGLEVDLETGLEIERMLFALALRDEGPRDRHDLVRRAGTGQGPVRGSMTPPLDVLVFYSPVESTEDVLAAVFAAGAGAIGNYRDCAFVAQGTGRFRPLEPARTRPSGPWASSSGSTRTGSSWSSTARLRADVVAALRAAHPYEEPAFHVIETADPDAHLSDALTRS